MDKPGKQNVVADFLSRLPNPPEGEGPIEDQFPDEHLFQTETQQPWFANIANYLATGKCPESFTSKEKSRMVRESRKYTLIDNFLYRVGLDEILRRCLREDEVITVIKAAHSEPCGGHFAAKRTGHKVLMMGYYWPSIFRDCHKFVKHCDPCQRTAKPSKTTAMPLQPIVCYEPFEKWGIDFIGPITPTSRKQHQHVLVCTDYVTKWAEARSFKNATREVVAVFLYEEIFTRFGAPRELTSDRGKPFLNKVIQALTEEYKIRHRKSTPYYPQANGQVEVTNRELERIIMKTVQTHRRDWGERLPEALWAYRTTFKSTTGRTPFELVYGKHAVLPIHLELKTFRTAQSLGLPLDEAQKQRMLQLSELDEIRQEAVQRTIVVQQQRKQWHDQRIKMKNFQNGDTVLVFDSRYGDFPGKFQHRWLGPYKILQIFDNGSAKLKLIEPPYEEILVNGYRMKQYRQPFLDSEFQPHIQRIPPDKRHSED